MLVMHPNVIYRYGGPAEFQLLLPTMRSGRNPDVAVVLKAKSKSVREDRPPSLVVEVVSRGRDAQKRDYLTKREEYLAYGIEEYWIVDPIKKRVVVLIRDGDAWVERVFSGNQKAQGLVLPGFWARPNEQWKAAAEKP